MLVTHTDIYPEQRQIVGPDPALSPTQYGVSIGPQAAGDLRLGQARLFLEPLEPLRE